MIFKNSLHSERIWPMSHPRAQKVSLVTRNSHFLFLCLFSSSYVPTVFSREKLPFPHGGAMVNQGGRPPGQPKPQLSQ